MTKAVEPQQPGSGEVVEKMANMIYRSDDWVDGYSEAVLLAKQLHKDFIEPLQKDYSELEAAYEKLRKAAYELLEQKEQEKSQNPL